MMAAGTPSPCWRRERPHHDGQISYRGDGGWKPGAINRRCSPEATTNGSSCTEWGRDGGADAALRGRHGAERGGGCSGLPQRAVGVLPQRHTDPRRAEEGGRREKARRVGLDSERRHGDAPGHGRGAGGGAGSHREPGDPVPAAGLGLRHVYGRHGREGARSYFENQWKSYLQKRGIADGVSKPIFPKDYGVAERDTFYASVSYAGWGGASGHDAPMIAYDAILGSGASWEELCNRGVFHGGDNDSTGAIAAAWWGAMYGFHGVPTSNHKGVEYQSRLETVAKKLFDLSHPSSPSEAKSDL
ncbi:uncharacterized protein LOC116966041 isoform X1 [Amblyraja radiata]|uniref:uncharacterized protein LOC116966041 isoform X1 n=1 Tax=Amblyraja radiata TaxID=386614 RepID=UPI001402231E|nr:uncharacterized protein LOC116966041 isoform X1 [Amblyraja radiata]